MHQAEDGAGSDADRDRGSDRILSMYVQKLGMVLNSVFQADLRAKIFARYKIAVSISRLLIALAFVFLIS